MILNPKKLNFYLLIWNENFEEFKIQMNTFYDYKHYTIESS